MVIIIINYQLSTINYQLSARPKGTLKATIAFWRETGVRAARETSERSQFQRSALWDACVACRSKKFRSTDLGMDATRNIKNDFGDVARNEDLDRGDISEVVVLIT